jgi:predicted phosphodiesterase
MRSLILLLIFIAPFTGISQEDNSKPSVSLTIAPVDGAVPYTHLDFNNSDESFQFAIVTDRTGGHRPGVFMDAVNKLNLLQPEFVMSVGDLIEGYTTDTIELKRQWNEFDQFVSLLEMPFFYVPGNHDITNQVMENLWRKRLGKTYYHFLYNDVLFLALNSEDQKRGAGRGTISDKQFEFIRDILKKHNDVKWTLIFLHQPLWHQKATNRWNEVEELLAERAHTVFAGHEHRYVKEDRNDGKYFTLATTGGGSALRGPKFGEFDHMVWVTMTEKGPIIANLLLEGILDENVVTSEHKNWLSTVSSENPFQITPVINEKIDFVEGIGQIKITNDRNVPMKVKFKEINSIDLIGIVDRQKLEVAPNSVEIVKYTLKTRSQLDENPFKLEATVSYITEDKYFKLEMPYVFNLKPVLKRTIKKVSNSLKIDGEENDWTELANKLPPGDDFNASFDLCYDDEFLYMAMKVNDSHVYSTGSGYVWKQDNIGLGFSAESFTKSAMNRGKNYYSEIFFAQISPENDAVKSVASSNMPEGTIFKCVQKPYGYFGEIAIPLSYIKSIQGNDWRTIRVGAAVDDFDKDSFQRYWWLANWRDAEQNYIGSGMYWRE